MPGDKRTAPQSLVEFMRARKKSACPICRFPVTVRRQLGPAAQAAGYTRRDQVDWLRDACGGGADVTMDALNAHLNQHHDTEEDLNG